MITQSYDVMEVQITPVQQSEFTHNGKVYRELQLKSKTGEIISIMLNAENEQQLTF